MTVKDEDEIPEGQPDDSPDDADDKTDEEEEQPEQEPQIIEGIAETGAKPIERRISEEGKPKTMFEVKLKKSSIVKQEFQPIELEQVSLKTHRFEPLPIAEEEELQTDIILSEPIHGLKKVTKVTSKKKRKRQRAAKDLPSDEQEPEVKEESDIPEDEFASAAEDTEEKPKEVEKY